MIIAQILALPSPSPSPAGIGPSGGILIKATLVAVLLLLASVAAYVVTRPRRK